MVRVPVRTVLACSAALAGGYVYFHPTNWINLGVKSNEKSARCDEVSSYIYLPENAGSNFEEYDYTFERKSNLPLYWKLLKLCKSKDHKMRLKAIKSLSKISSLKNWEYIMIAQACDAQTSISLARHSDANPYFFLPPPFKDLNEGNVQNDLFNLLLYLPLSNDVYIENLRRLVVKNAKSFLKNEYSLDLEVGDPSVLFHSQQKKRLVYLFDERILQIFLGYSATSYYRKLMIDKGILKLLHKVLRSHDKEPKIQSLIGQILSNFALEAKFTKPIYMAGWIGILSSWAKSSNIMVNLPAAKALANLDKDDVFSSLYDDGVYILNPVFRQSQTEPILDVIFVHGLLGATFWTWRQCETQKKSSKIISSDERKEKSSDLNKNFYNYSMCWPKDWLAVDIPLLRIISVDYKASISTWSSKSLEEKEQDIIRKNSRELINKMLLSNVGERPIIWITHSMGGLIVKQILVEASESKEMKLKMLAQKTCGIVFYSVPHKGSELAKKISSASRILLPSTDFAQLEKGSPRLVILHEKFKNFILNYHIPVLSFGETKKTHWGLSSSVLVSLDSADPGIGEFYALPVNHLSVCKPISHSSFDYEKVLQFLHDNLYQTISHNEYSPSQQKKMFEVSKVLCLIP